MAFNFDEQFFYKKYLYYKNKYLELKLNSNLFQQNGGTINNHINIISFNVLNEDPGSTLMTFKNNSDVISKLLLEKENKSNKKQLNNIYKNLIQLEKREWNIYRKNKILQLVKYFINSNHVVCLQEVSENLLNILKTKYNGQLCWTYNPINKNTVGEYRVIIVPNNYSIIKCESLIFEDLGLKRKDCLMAELSDKNSNNFLVFNLHIYWKAEQNHYEKFANIILDTITKYKLPFVICGDFNGIITHPYIKNFIEIINNEFKIDTNNSNYLNDFTSVDTKTKNEYGWIDHILTHGFKILEPTSTLNKINEYEIYYDVKQIIGKLITFKKKLIEKNGLDKKMLQIFDNKKWVSDHKPVFIKLLFE
jgi:endonuclease/exonuclease/phosphatase family metal-dependent hydrolase